jgi:hypothetical protein
MIKFPNLGRMEPSQRKMSSEEYLEFCDFCIRNNPRITSENCLSRKSGEEEIKVPFRI